MSDEPSIKTKMDVLDLVISFIMEHEKQMDHMMGRIENILNVQAKKNIRTVDKLYSGDPNQRDLFSITVENSDQFGPVKSIRIDWETKNESQSKSKVDVILDEIEQTLKDE